MIQPSLRLKGIGLALFGLLVLAACDMSPTPTPILPVPTATSVPATPAPTNTAAPAPTNTTAPAPTSTTAPAATNTPAPAATNTASAPIPPPATATTGGTAPGSSTWQHVLSETAEVLALAAAPGVPSTLYAGEKFYRSTDSGQTWATLTPGFAVSEIAVALSDAQIVYAGGAEGCASGNPGDLRQSTDGGTTWATRSGGPANLDIDATDPTHLLGIRCDGVYRSTDSGKTWAKLPGTGVTNFDGRYLARGINDRTVLYAAYVSEGGSLTLGRTTDDGLTWQTAPVANVQGPTDLAVDPADAQRVYVLTTSGVLLSTDGGKTWNHTDKGLERAGSDITGNPLMVSNLVFDQGSRSPAGTTPTLYLGEVGFERPPRIRRWNGTDQWAEVAVLNEAQTIHRLVLGTEGRNPALLAATEQGIFRLPLSTLAAPAPGVTPAGTAGPAPAGTWQPVSQQVKDVRVLRTSPPPAGATSTLYLSSDAAGIDGKPAHIYRWNGQDAWVAVADTPTTNSIDPLVFVPDPTHPALLAANGDAIYRLLLR